MTVGEAVEAAFSPVLAPLGYRVTDRSDEGRRFEGPAGSVNAAYVWRDGDLQVTIAPRDGGQTIDLSLYLAAIGSEIAARIGDGVAESEAEIVAQAPTYAAGLRHAARLLEGDASEIEWARQLRFWHVHPEYLEPSASSYPVKPPTTGPDERAG